MGSNISYHLSMDETATIKAVSLHKDKDMWQAKENGNQQPLQLDLFKMLVSPSYSNSVELYQSLPDVYSGNQENSIDKFGLITTFYQI